ncbi:hypothetical protein HGP17_10740 [Rhizobium sp. P38BS-XIX]|uniref:hypothetical protein n=1 Tax=Rhizobium sp. P38BS-XIX TaxID=2726740 RepID=UPI0014577967|nr:hypothetical protein [Rhizobium sp. P38BS-XIX]NLR97306.1 hypothetical protein [Rhizobium sp. P38BS-XIX]
MERLQRLSKGAMLPTDLDKVRKVFNTAVSQTWFDENEYSKEGFAAQLIALFHCGIVRSEQLTKIGLLLALNEFSRDMSSIQRSKLKAAYEFSRPSGAAT